MKMIFEHVGMTVSDLDRSIDFYTRVFGFRLLRRTSINAYLYLGNDLIELVQGESSSEKEKPKTVEDWVNEMQGPIGLSHIGFRVDNLDEAIERIRDSGGELVVRPLKFEPEVEYAADLEGDKLRRATKPPEGRGWWRIAAFSDPDGIILEILER